MNLEFNQLFITLDIFGTFVFAVSGAISGIKRKMDLFGIIILAIVTSSGGGILRSLLTGDTPINFLIDPSYILVATLAALIVFLFRNHFLDNEKILKIFDALGIGIFLSLGISIALQDNLSYWAAILVGVITASFGGVIRDILSAQVPLIFRKELYATACLIGGIIYIFLLTNGYSEEFTIIIAALFVILIRLIAIKYKLSLPK